MKDSSKDCVCDPLVDSNGNAYNQFIGTWFNDWYDIPAINHISIFTNLQKSIYSTNEYAAFIAGWISIGLYVVAMLPQLFKNYRLKSVDGLSFTFLFIWLLGDLSNCAGAILTNQYPSVQYAAIYFLLSDAITLIQYAYYSKGSRRWFFCGKRGRSRDEREAEEADEDIFGGKDEQSPLFGSEHSSSSSSSAVYYDAISEVQSSDSETSRNTIGGSIKTLKIPILVSTLLFALVLSPSDGVMADLVVGPLMANISALSTKSTLCNYAPELNRYVIALGSILAWMSGLLYFFSRLPQIFENHRLKTVGGLSIWLFIITISANIAYGISIISRWPPMDQKFFQSTLPYLIGSVGTLVFDTVIIMQASFYGKKPHF